MDAEILLVEDNVNDAELAIRALRKNNIANTILHLQNGAEALNYLFGKEQYASRNTWHKPKVILLDLKMPKINGLEVLKQIKANGETKIIPAVVLTSSKENPDIKEAYMLGANSYIVKPVDFDKFQKTIGEIGIYWLAYNHQSI